MITAKEIKKLNEVKSEIGLVSLYLNTDQRLQTPEKILINLGNLLKEMEDELPKSDRQRIEKFVESELDQKIGGIAFFIDLDGNFWREYKFRKLVRNGIYKENNLHLTQLEELLDEYEQYCVVVVDKEKARVFTVFLGEIQEITEVFNEFPGKHAQGGWSQKRFQGHTEDHLQRHLKEVADKAYSFWQQDNFDRLIVAGSKEVLPKLEKILPNDLKNRLAGEFATELFKSDEHFLQKSLVVEEKIEREQESKQVKELADNLGGGNKAVSGIRDVVQAINDQKVMKLVVSEGFTQPGYYCPEDDLLCLDDNYGGGREIEALNDLVDELIQRAIAQGAKIEFVKDSEELRGLGEIGAWLRY